MRKSQWKQETAETDLRKLLKSYHMQTINQLCCYISRNNQNVQKKGYPTLVQQLNNLFRGVNSSLTLSSLSSTSSLHGHKVNAAAPGFTTTQLPEAKREGYLPAAPCKSGASKQASLPTSQARVTSHTMAEVTIREECRWIKTVMISLCVAVVISKLLIIEKSKEKA